MSKSSKSTQYSLLASAFLLSTPACDPDDPIYVTNPPSQIPGYVDIDPDIYLSYNGNDQVSLDLNNDGINDFQFNLEVSNTTNYLEGSLSLRGLYNNEVATSSYQWQYNYNGIIYQSLEDEFARNLPPNFTVGGTLNFNGGLNYMAYINQFVSVGTSSSIQGGAWLGVHNDKFLGIRVYDSGQFHYGWIRLSVNAPISGSSWSLTIKDYAIAEFPSAPITTQIARNLENEDVAVYTHDRNVVISDKKERDIKTRIKNKKGEEVFKSIINKKKNIELEKGIYKLELDVDGKKTTKEIIIE